MSTFTAKIIAELDTSKIPSAIEKIKQQKVALQNIQVNKVELSQNATSTLASQVQNALNAKNFTVNINGVKMSGDVTGSAGNGIADKISKSISERIKLKIDTGTLDSQIARVTDKFDGLKSRVQDVYKVKIEPDLNSLNELKAKIESSFNADGTVKDIGGLQSNWAKYETALKRVTNNLSQASIENKKYVSSLQVKNLDDKMLTWLAKNTKASKTFGVEIKELQQELRSLGDTPLDADFQPILNKFKEIDQGAEEAGAKGKKLGEQFSGAFHSILNYVSVSTVIYKSIEAIQKMYQEVLAIDTAMTSLKKVTDETDSTYQNFLSNAAVSAQELGRSISSLVDQTATWAKLGYSLSESEDLAKLSSIYANVAEVDDATAVSDMVTAMKAFNIEAENAINIVDPLNELGNRFATDAASLGEGLSKSASAMNTAGTDMYETLAMLTGGAEITQSAGEFGNFLKVASMRIRGMTGDLQDLGEEVDESVNSISKVQTQILNLTHGKVNIFDDNDEFRNYYEIMQDIAAIYEDLSSTDQAALSEILFGKMRANQGAALMQAFQSGQIEKAYQTAVNSQGSAEKEQERWMDSLEAKTKQLEAAWQDLSRTFLDSDFLKGLVSFGTGALNVITDLTDALGPAGLLATITAITLAFKNFGNSNELARYGCESIAA